MKSTITPLLKYEIVDIFKTDIFPTYANTYVAIGRPIRWGDDLDPESPTEIEDIKYSVDYVNQAFRDMVAMKKVEAADVALVVPRIDWKTGVHYDRYESRTELYSFTKKLSIGTANANGNIVVANTAVFTGNISVGNTVSVGSVTKEVIAANATHLTVNSNFGSTITNGLVIRLDDTYPHFANNFYVRNSKDQVFKCLSDDGGTVSTVEPTADIDGQLPENPFILTGDGYKWKYLYTIPYGLKQKFFTNTWMPVVDDAAVQQGSIDGRIDIIEILDGGSGYFLDNGESGNSSSLAIINVTGDGVGAQITAKVESGVITALNILDGGANYTTANVTVVDPDQLASGNAASFRVVISPPGGHGSKPAKELGCYSVMTCVELIGTESDRIPVGTNIVPFDFRQILLIRDPVLANGIYATDSVYRTTTKLVLTDPGITDFINDETVYVGTSLETATFVATVVNWKADTSELFVNNIRGSGFSGNIISGDTSAATSTIISIVNPEIDLFTGDILYIENRDKIIRDVDQTEQIRLVLSL